jgi:alpha-ketoglutarate-dependent 2,4-dichlorophenoxyacetate dioxygenase
VGALHGRNAIAYYLGREGSGMALATRPLHPLFGIEVLSVDITRLDDTSFHEIVSLFNEHSVLVFRDQHLTDDQQIAFSRRFGPLETTIRSIATQERTLPEIANLANVDAEDRLIPAGDQRNAYNAGNQMWHTDSSFKRVPAMASLLSARECPPSGGETQFASTRVAYARLPDDMKRFLEGKVAVHSFAYSRGLVGDGLLPPEHAAQVPPVRQALVRVNPVNGRRNFFVGSHACEIPGMPTDEARALLRELRELATLPERVYTHTWQPGDLVMWDNRCVLHRGRPWDESRYRRVMHRTTVAGDGPTAPDDGPTDVSPARELDVARGRSQLGGG